MTILCAEGAFHAQLVCWRPLTAAFRVGFGPMPAGFDHVPFGNLNALRNKMGSHVAAIMVKLSRRGWRQQVPEGYLAGVRSADEFGALVIADEVQAGIGRTGYLFSYEPAGIKPDIVALAKGLPADFRWGGYCEQTVGNAMTPGTHGSTFGGNPLAMAAAATVRCYRRRGVLAST